MAGGIDWLRWHHGTVTDQKFPLIAKRSGASVAEVIAVWACLLEAASMNENERGQLGSEPDFESMDCALGMDEGKAKAIYGAMTGKGLIDSDRQITAWTRRQPKREREDTTAADRKRAERERKASAGAAEGGAPSGATDSRVTQRHATSHQKTPRGEESRGEKNKELPEQAAESVPTVTPAAEICRALRVAGVAAVQSQHPMLLALVDAGATLTEFVDAVPSAVGKRDAFAYLLSVVKGRRDDAARDATALARGNLAQGPPHHADRKQRQLATAAVLTGQTPQSQPIRTLHPDAIDVESRVIAP